MTKAQYVKQMKRDYNDWSSELNAIQQELTDYEMLILAFLDKLQKEQSELEAKYYLQLIYRYLDALHGLREGVEAHSTELEQVKDNAELVKLQYDEDHTELEKGIVKERFMLEGFREKLFLFVEDVVQPLPEWVLC